MRRFESHYRLQSTDYATPDTFNPRFRDLDDRLNAQEDLRAQIEALQQTLIAQAAGRIDDVLLPALDYVRTIQQGGFLTAGIAQDTSLEFVEGTVAVAVDQTLKAIFRPTPFVAIMRSSTHEDWAVAQALGYDAETGVLSLDIVAVNGEAGPHEDVIFSATSGSLQAQIAYITPILEASTAATEAAEAVATAAETVDIQAGQVSGWRDEVLGYKNAAEEAAEAAALLDPSSFYTKSEIDATVQPSSAKLTAVAALTWANDKGVYLTGASALATYDLTAFGRTFGGYANAATAFGNIKQAATTAATGVLEIATAAEIQAGAAGTLAVTAAGVKDALALATPSGGANWTPDWSAFAVADWNVTANRTLNNPTSVVAGTTRYVFVRANSGTERTISFGSNFKGDLPTLDDVTNAKWYLLALVAYSTSHIVVSAVVALS